MKLFLTSVLVLCSMVPQPLMASGADDGKEDLLGFEDAVNIPEGVMTAVGEIKESASDVDPKVVATQERALALHQQHEASWIFCAQSLAFCAQNWGAWAAKGVAKKALQVPVEYAGLGAAWILNHNFATFLEEMTAIGIGGAAAFVAGPAVGGSVYTATRQGLQAANYVIPFYNKGKLAAIFVPATKVLIIDPTVKYTPIVAAGAAQCAAQAAKFAVIVAQEGQGLVNLAANKMQR